MLAQKVIPVHKAKGLFGSMPEFADNPVLFIEKYRPELGDIFSINVVFKKFYIICKPDVAKYILQTNQKNYTKDIAYKELALALGNGLVTSEGDFWRKQRRIAQPTFYRKQLSGLFEIMRDETEQYAKELAVHKGSGKAIDISREMMSVTAKIAMHSLFSSEIDNQLDLVYDVITDSQDYIVNRIRRPYKRPLYYFNGRKRKFEKNLKIMDDVIFDLINRRRGREEEYTDLLSMLMMSKYEDTGEGMSDKQLRDECVTLFSAGHETSANAMAWMWYLLSKNPDVFAKLKTEIEAVVGEGTIQFEDLRKMPYTRQVIEETMRVYPPVWAVGRQNIEKDTIEGIEYPKDSLFLIGIHAIHHHPDFWENPEKFDPDRFTPDKVKARPKMHYFPFGAGPRMCIGNHFAMMEMQLLLVALARKFSFKLKEGHPVEIQPLVTLRPKHGMMMFVE